MATAQPISEANRTGNGNLTCGTKMSSAMTAAEASATKAANQPKKPCHALSDALTLMPSKCADAV